MAAFATYAVGFFARPVGGVVFAHYGDRLGRKAMLVLTLVMMGLATFLIGLLPSYEQIGIAAPLLLVTLRFVQGLGVGGEWGGAVLMAVEHGHSGRRGFYGSWAQAGVPVGLLLATGVFALCARMPESQFLAWGWRIPFLAGIALTGIGLFIRLSVQESPLFAAEQRKPAPISEGLPIAHVWRAYRKNVLLAIGARFGENISFYVLTVFLLTYATGVVGLANQDVFHAILLASGVTLISVWLAPETYRSDLTQSPAPQALESSEVRGTGTCSREPRRATTQPDDAPLAISPGK